jgi:hypothetical protein
VSAPGHANDAEVDEQGERTMNWTRFSLYYLCGYLLLGGFRFLFFPAEGLRLFLSTGDYGDVFPRVAGMLLAGLGMTVLGIILTRSEALYPATLLVRVFFLTCLAAFYVFTRDPLFLVLFAIVGFGFVLTLTSYLLDRSQTG